MLEPVNLAFQFSTTREFPTRIHLHCYISNALVPLQTLQLPDSYECIPFLFKHFGRVNFNWVTTLFPKLPIKTIDIS
jgi:hypothetical protein